MKPRSVRVFTQISFHLYATITRHLLCNFAHNNVFHSIHRRMKHINRNTDSCISKYVCGWVVLFSISLLYYFKKNLIFLLHANNYNKMYLLLADTQIRTQELAIFNLHISSLRGKFAGCVSLNFCSTRCLQSFCTKNASSPLYVKLRKKSCENFVKQCLAWLSKPIMS